MTNPRDELVRRLRQWAARESPYGLGALLNEAADALASQPPTDAKVGDAALRHNLRVAAQWWRDNQDSPKSALSHFMQIAEDAAAPKEST